MNLTVYQTIQIQNLRIDAISNSSVLQIGTAGLIKPFSRLYNTGKFTGPAPELVPAPEFDTGSLVPLAPPSAG